MQKPPTVTDYRGHRRTLFPVREINLKAYADAILTQITLPALGFKPRAMHRHRRTVLSHEDRAGDFFTYAKVGAPPKKDEKSVINRQ